MPTDPICGMTVKETAIFKTHHNGNTFFFCSKHCLNKFQKKRGGPVRSPRPVPKESPIAWLKNKTIIIAIILLSVICLSYGIPFLAPFRNALVNYFKVMWWAVLLGLTLGGCMEHYIPREYISSLLSKRRKRTIFYSVLLGFFMSVCSHGILAIAIQLHKKGASNPAVVAFLLASPWANMVLTIVLISFFGLKALFIILAAILIALSTGFIFQFLEGRNWIESNRNTVLIEDLSVPEDLKRRWKNYTFSFKSLRSDLQGIYEGIISLSNMVLWWILIGMGLASIAGAYIPPDLFQNYLGPTLTGLAVTLAIATVIEVCSEGSAPISFEIFQQTGALGNSFVFLMAGVVTDYTEIGLLWHNVGKRVAIWLPLVTVPQVLVIGCFANILF